MYRTFKYRLFTNNSQGRELGIMLETHRRLYNACLDQRKITYEREGRSVNYPEQSLWFKSQRKTNPFFARVNFSSAQATMRRLDRTYQNFFRRVSHEDTKLGYPRFKPRHRFNSFSFPAYGDGIRLNGNRLRVRYVGIIKVNLHRPYSSMVKTATLLLEGNKWFLIMTCDIGSKTTVKSTLPAIGIDMGIESFLTTSDGDHEPNPRFLKSVLPELRRRNRSVSRKKKNSRGRCKAINRLRKLHVRAKNLRRDHAHKVALKLVRRYGKIAVESLNVNNMVRNHRLARSISDAGWSGFLSILRSKAESAGAEVIDVDPSYTSQLCSGCGKLTPKTLSDRWHKCICGCSLHRDINAAINILARGLARIRPAEGNVDPKVKRSPKSRCVRAVE